MAESDGLRDLQMGKAGHDSVGMLFRQVEQGRLQTLDQDQQLVD